MATSQELISQLITEASTLTEVFRNYRTNLDASVLASTTAISNQLNASMSSIIAGYNTAVTDKKVWVDNNGLDTNDGLTINTAFKTLAKALTMARPNMTLTISLVRGQIHVLRGMVSINGSIYITHHSTPAMIAIEPRTANVWTWATGTDNGTNRYYGGGVATTLNFEDYKKTQAVIQFEESHGLDLSTFNTRWANEAEVAAYAATPEWANRTYTCGFRPNASVVQNFNIYLGGVLLSGPRWDLVKPSYRKILKTNDNRFIPGIDHGSTFRVSTYGTVFKLNFGQIIYNNSGPGRYELSFYNSLTIMDKNWTMPNERFAVMNAKVLVYDATIPTLVFSDGSLSTTAERMAVSSSSVLYPKGAVSTNDSLAPINVISQYGDFTPKTVADGLASLETYKYVAV